MVKLEDKIDKNVFIDLYLNQKKTMKEIANYFNIKYSAVSTLKNLWGINRKNDPMRKIIDKELLIDLYVNKNMGKWEIAEYLEICYSSVNKNLKRYNIVKDPQYLINSISKDYISGKSTTELAKIYNRPKSRIRNLLITNGVKLRDKYTCHCNNMSGEILNPDVFRSKKASFLRKKVNSHFKNHISIPMKKETPYCTICGNKNHLHVHHLIPLSIIINNIVNENKGKPDEELYQIIINDPRYLDEKNMIVVCEKCHYTIFHPYVNYHANQQLSIINNNESSETISRESTPKQVEAHDIL